VNFYRHFLPAAASLLQPLTDALRGEARARDSLPWSTEMEAAFCSIKTALANAALLADPTPGAEICLMVDASANHVGAALQQQPLGFFSKKLNPTQQRYSAFDRELLACTAGIRHFRHMLDGREFSILTDHKPITFALARATDAWMPRQGHQLSYIAEYTSNIRHISGKENVVVNTMSRPPAAPRTAGPAGAHTAGQDSCLTAGPACAHNTGPDSCLTTGPASTHTAGPDSSAWLEETLAGLNSLTAEVPPTCAAEINFSAMAAAQPGCGHTQATMRSSSLQVVNQQDPCGVIYPLEKPGR
jgi:hypothetical protein